MELKAISCPNCGANTNDVENCEYCGSLLVRFVDKGIDLSKTSYTNNDQVIPGLIEELQKNLELQKANPDVGAVTDLYFLNSDGSSDTINILPSKQECTWVDGTDINLNNGKEGFVISLNFCKFTGSYTGEEAKEVKKINDKIDKQRKAFCQLDSFNLFTSHMTSFVFDGEQQYGPEYAINFGQDVEGAARLISEIWVKVKGHSKDEPVDFLTNVGVDNVNKARNQWDIAHGIKPSYKVTSDDAISESKTLNTILYVVAIIILNILLAVCCS